MDRQALKTELKTTIAYLLELDDFGDDQHFMRDLGADSMLLTEVVARVEKRYGVTFPEAELRRTRSLNELVEVVTRLLGLGA